MTVIEKKPFDMVISETSDQPMTRKPLMIACSGGGGHNTAIKGICDYFAEQNYISLSDLPDYTPIPYAKKRKMPSGTRHRINNGIEVMYAFGVGKPIRAMVGKTRFPVLPDKKDIDEEILVLDQPQKRKYVDVLLDIYPAGHESAAIWNILQRKDQARELKKLIHMQPSIDKKHRYYVYDFFIKKLKAAALEGNPYTELISTQAMSLPALCNVVKDYNAWLSKFTHINAPKIAIHQYMTDLPTKGAVHYFKALSLLSRTQQQQMKLYGVGLNQKIIHKFFPKTCAFQGLFDIPEHDNPMIRKGFKNKQSDLSNQFHNTTRFTLAGNCEFIIPAHQQIASIMLGSQAGADTAKYIETLIENGVSKVFVFGGTTRIVSAEIDKILGKHPEYSEKIIKLPNQKDEHIAPLMTRSNIVIIRGGGLSVMEQMAINHTKEQTVLIHHANTDSKRLTSGISWEDENVNSLISYLQELGVHAKKTSPERAKCDIPQARLLACVHALKPELNPDDCLRHITKLSDDGLLQCVKQLKESELAHSGKFPEALNQHIDVCEEKARKFGFVLSVHCQNAKKRLSDIIEAEAKKFECKKQKINKSKLGFFTRVETSNIDQIVENTKNGAYKNASSKFHQALKSYQALTKLQLTIDNKDSSRSYSRKLLDFKNEFNNKRTKKAIYSNTDNIFIRMMREIKYLFSKIFGSTMERHLSDHMLIRKRMYDLKTNENKAIKKAVKIYATVCHKDTYFAKAGNDIPSCEANLPSNSCKV